MMADFVLADLLPALPELVLLGMACTVLILDLFLADDLRWITFALALAALGGAALATVLTLDPVPTLAFANTFVDDRLADVLKLMLDGAVAAVLIYSRDYLRARGMDRGEFYVLVLFATLGMMIMISASHFLTLYLGLELLSLCLYALVGLKRDDRLASEAAMKYFVLGALASGLLLYGMSLLYGVTGSLELARVAAALPGMGADPVLVFGLVFVVAGLAFKLGVVPFHMWIPDVYQGAPTAITLFIGSAPKLAAFAFFMRLLVDGLQALAADWQPMLALMAVLSIALGNVTAIAQTNIKRMLAYSTISHMGFVLLGFLAGSEQGYSAAFFYVAAYVLMSLGGFAMILLLSREGFEAEALDHFKGLNQRSPWHAFLMLLLMFSMAGVPPTVGFYAKLSVLKAALDAGFLWLVVFAVLMSVAGAFYYLRVVKLMYFDAPSEPAAPGANPGMQVLLSANGLAVLALGLMPQPLMALCATAIRQMV
ncbi:NADH-quinone oxidoreductase subunit NuoN [Thiobacter aerophilum]|uniref:NADH-quinone oxidoreductase subunit N n=1 Tax=Thiobacter aerophilum TaxID=3121275 RepID=A0ABV0EFS5_9BURK